MKPPPKIPYAKFRPNSMLSTYLLLLLFLYHDVLVSGSSQRVLNFQKSLKDQLLLAPLTRGGNLPFRRLCSDADFFSSESHSSHHGANFTMSEMAYARQLIKGDKRYMRKERALLKFHKSEHNFGFQIATKSAEEAIRAISLANDEGATWVDLNCGCPIYEATRRGLGAELLKRPDSLAKLVSLIVDGKESDIPFTVKIRIGPSDSKINVDKVVHGLVDAGVAAVTIHGRTMTQRYTRPANWKIISTIGSNIHGSVPIIGNGDILTWYEAQDRLSMDGVDALMVGRGALIKPWIFQEFSTGRSFYPTAHQRIAVYYRLANYFKDHFGFDDYGKRHSFYFLPWHFEFFCRYRPLPEEIFRETCRNTPLIQNSRLVDDALFAQADEHIFSQDPLEKLLRDESQESHLAISHILWDSESLADAIAGLENMAVQVDVSGSYSRSDRQILSDETSWEAGGAGPRADMLKRATNSPSYKNASLDMVSEKKRSRDLSSRWIPLPITDQLSVLEVRVGKVISSYPHPTADTLVVNLVDLGTRNCEIITGRGSTSDSLVNTSVAVVVNLKPRRILDVLSYGLILFSHCIGDKPSSVGGEWSPIRPPIDELAGTLLEWPGITASAATLKTFTANRANRAWKAVCASLQVRNGVAVFYHNNQYLALQANGKVCTSRVDGGII